MLSQYLLRVERFLILLLAGRRVDMKFAHIDLIVILESCRLLTLLGKLILSDQLDLFQALQALLAQHVLHSPQLQLLIVIAALWNLSLRL